MGLSKDYQRAMRERMEFVHPPFQRRPDDGERKRTGPCDSRLSLAVPGAWLAEVDAGAAMLGQSRSMVIRGVVEAYLKPYLEAGGRVYRPGRLTPEDLAQNRTQVRPQGNSGVDPPPPRPVILPQ